MRTSTVLVTVAVVVAMVASVPVAGLAATDATVGDQHESDDESATNETADDNASVAPGERLSGVVGIQAAELDGEVDGRAFGLKVARAASNDSTADVVGDQLQDVEQRLADIEQRKQELNESRENGSISEGTYRAEVAALAAQTETAKQLTNQSENATEGLPADLLQSKGINTSAIQTLKDRAADLSGPQVAKIAQSIAGKNAAPGVQGPNDRPDQAGMPENATDRGGQADGGADQADGGADQADGADGDAESDDQTPTATARGGDGSSNRP